MVNFNLVAKCYVGLAADEQTLDSSTLSLFRGRLPENRKTTAFEMLLQEAAIAAEQGVVLGSRQFLGSVHVIADVYVPKDDYALERGAEARPADAAA